MSDTDHARSRAETNPGERGKWVSALIALAGVWLLAEPFLFGVVAANFWNDVVLGALLVALGGYNYYRRTNGRTASTGASALAALLGLWLVVSPWVYGAGATVNPAGFWNDVVIGLVVLALGAYSVYEAREHDVATPTR